MLGFNGLAKTLIIMGLAMVGIGFVMLIGGKLLPLGKLPGDILFQKGNFTLFMPIISSIVISIVLTIILNLIFRR